MNYKEVLDFFKNKTAADLKRAAYAVDAFKADCNTRGVDTTDLNNIFRKAYDLSVDLDLSDDSPACMAIAFLPVRLSDSARQRLADEVTRLSKRWRDLGGLTVDNSCFPHWESVVCDCIGNGSYPHVEISCYDSVSGHTDLITFDYDDLIMC